MQAPDRDAAETRHIDTVPPIEAEDYPWAHAAVAQEDVPPPRLDQDPPRPDWYAPYEALQRDWGQLIERVQQTGEPLFYAERYADMIPRIQALAENPDIPAETRAPMIEALENHHRDLSARKHLEDHLDAAVRHMDTHASLQRVADGLGVPIVQISDHLGWRQEADRLMATAEAILADDETYGVHLDNMESGRARVEGKTISAAPRHPGRWRICLPTQNTGTARRTCGYTGESRTTRAAEPAWMPALRSHAPGLEQPHRRRPANRHPLLSTPRATWTSSRASGN